MDTPSFSVLVQQLSKPQAYPHPVNTVQVRQTHASVVFLAGRYAYKIKKPVHLGFLDYSTLQKRKHFCQQEVALNRRLAPAVYLDVVPITYAQSVVAVAGNGSTVEWAVKMVRLPDQATLEARLKNKTVDETDLEAVARKLARFHADARSGPEVVSYGRYQTVARNAVENFAQTVAHIGQTVSQPVFKRLREHTQEQLMKHRQRIEQRAQQNIPCDTHGDLRLEHVYLLPLDQQPGGVVVVDCIEFNDRFRYADPVADIAFLVMDLIYHSARPQAARFTDAYFDYRKDPEGRQLLSFYTAYRSTVRAKVLGIKFRAMDIHASERQVTKNLAAAHWMLALDELSAPGKRPALLLMGGLPGTGKSTVARALADQAGFQIVSTDNVRQTVVHADSGSSGTSRYTPEAKTAVYEKCLEEAEQALWQGKRVIVDATFHRQKRRTPFWKLGKRLGVRTVMLICQAKAQHVRQRLSNRKDDPSEADWSVYQALAQKWQPFDTPNVEQPAVYTLTTDDPIDLVVEQAKEYLTAEEVYEE